MELKLYGIKDEVVGEIIFFLPSQNDGTMVRAVKGALLVKEPNQINTDIKDKSVYCLGSMDTCTGNITPLSPVYVKRVSEIRQELVNEIKIAKAEIGEKEPNADEVVGEDGAAKGLNFGRGNKNAK